MWCAADLTVWTAWPCGSCPSVCIWLGRGEVQQHIRRSRVLHGTRVSHSLGSRCSCGGWRWLFPRMPRSPATWPTSTGHWGLQTGSSLACQLPQRKFVMCLSKKKRKKFISIKKSSQSRRATVIMFFKRQIRQVAWIYQFYLCTVTLWC